MRSVRTVDYGLCVDRSTATPLGRPQRIYAVRVPLLAFCGVAGAPALWPQMRRRFGRAPGRPAARRCLRIEMRMETALL